MLARVTGRAVVAPSNGETVSQATRDLSGVSAATATVCPWDCVHGFIAVYIFLLYFVIGFFFSSFWTSKNTYTVFILCPDHRRRVESQQKAGFTLFS
ncbi:hypothetical protein PoB_002337200 [Plakobranchus ocellatus]|uniref:Uncharacterized protein n=1 Tax=Plakobranchus ocellatus TaxID=259542 RepID=A0AAV3ZQC8_9GAST|nr:hypothetical protein PoB_002337200 [Plakobranchus ocellatus]